MTPLYLVLIILGFIITGIILMYSITKIDTILENMFEGNN